MELEMLSWNVRHQGFATRLPRVVEAVAASGADLACLQEVPARDAADVLSGLATAGLTYGASSAVDYVKGVTKRYGNVIVSRWPVAVVPPETWIADTPFPELVLRATVQSPVGVLDVITVHIPNYSGNREKKTAALSALQTAICREPQPLRIVTGDFNTPKKELAGGTVKFFGSKQRQAAERAAFLGLTQCGLTDAVTAVRGVDPSAYSHRTTAGNTRRFDHVFVGEALTPVSCGYEVGWLDAGLSDHAAVHVRVRSS